MKHLTYKKIGLEVLDEWVASLTGDIGSVVTFTGHVRRDNLCDKSVIEIEYEGYPEMADKVVEDIIEETVSKFKIRKVFVKHRLGIVRAGEIAFIVSVQSGHRKEGFEAIQYVVTEFKKKGPNLEKGGIFGWDIAMEGGEP